MILGVDVGGTFTDLVLLDDAGQMTIHKLLTSAHDPAQAIVQGLTDLGAGPETTLVHGTTVATNALLERRGAATALITTAGFGDVIEIGRQTRSELYDLHPSRPEPLVPGHWRFEVQERVDAHGSVLVPLDMDQVDALVRQIAAEGIESVAVCLLFSFLHPDHEQKIGERIAAMAKANPMASQPPAVSLSCDILPEFREYERTSTTVINAYVSPLMRRYLSNLEPQLEGRHLRIMQSNGGIISADTAGKIGARTVLSGPAGGVVGAFEVAQRAGFDQVITFDMGGTSTDVSLCPGKIEHTTEGTIAGLPLGLPSIDIHTVGAGGGSIAWRDAGGALRVGPQSAGSEPGPVCYGQPEAREVTVTDAHLILGRLDRSQPLGGTLELDVTRTQTRMQELGRRLSLPVEATAWGIIRVANSNMERAIRAISIERGHDPRRFTLVAFGGAGPLHACELASALSIPRVLIPPHPGVLSALGMVLTDVIKDYSQTVMLPANRASADDMIRLFLPLRERARADLCQEGLAEEQMHMVPALDMRYAGQSYELTIPLAADTDLAEIHSQAHVERFHRAHLQRFSYASEDEPVQIVNLRLKAIGRTTKPRFAKERVGRLDPSRAQLGYRQIYFADQESPGAARPVPAALYQREKLASGNIVIGPAALHQLDTTTIVAPGWAATVDGWGNLVVERSRT